jgi:AcrR family transcriptional regulator
MQAVSRVEQKAITRERVVAGALELFADKGILATTTADIARCIGMSHGVIFLHFPKRDDLVIAVIDELGRRLSAAFRQALGESVGLEAVLRAHLGVLEDFEPVYARLVIEAPLLPPKVRGTLLMLQAAIAGYMARAAERERGQGRVREMELPLLFNTWIGLVHHYLVNRDVFCDGPSVLAARGPELIRHFMQLVATEG